MRYKYLRGVVAIMLFVAFSLYIAGLTTLNLFLCEEFWWGFVVIPALLIPTGIVVYVGHKLRPDW